MNVVFVREENAPAGETPLEWMLLTTEPVATFAEAQTVVEYYEKRWRIEEFHKAWKSGYRVEERPFQTLDALERMTAITHGLDRSAGRMARYQAHRPCRLAYFVARVGDTSGQGAGLARGFGTRSGECGPVKDEVKRQAGWG